jgi:ribosomal protein S12 methylthiotransferase accessory factor YcaO-like protein
VYDGEVQQQRSRRGVGRWATHVPVASGGGVGGAQERARWVTSNGVAVSGCLTEAIFCGLLEIAERDAFLMTWYGRLIRPPDYDESKGAQRSSDFHRMMFTNRAYHRAVFENPVFSRYRLLINYTYLQINRLGLTPPERFRLCHLAANAVEDLYNYNAINAVSRYVAAHPGRP